MPGVIDAKTGFHDFINAPAKKITENIKEFYETLSKNYDQKIF